MPTSLTTGRGVLLVRWFQPARRRPRPHHRRLLDRRPRPDRHHLHRQAEHDLYVMYIGGTTIPMSSRAELRFRPDHRRLLVEIDFNHKYMIYEQLAAIVELSSWSTAMTRTSGTTMAPRSATRLTPGRSASASTTTSSSQTPHIAPFRPGPSGSGLFHSRGQPARLFAALGRLPAPLGGEIPFCRVLRALPHRPLHRPRIPARTPLASAYAQPAGPAVEDTVRDIIEAVAARGDTALWTIPALRLPGVCALHAGCARKPHGGALNQIRPRSGDHRRGHGAHRDVPRAPEGNSWWQTEPDGTILGQLVRPLDRAGLYVPGGAGGNTRSSPA